MGCSTLHIKTELECRVFLFEEEKGIAKPGSYFNLEVRKGEQDLLFVNAEDETLRCSMLYNVEENDCDYRILIEKSQFTQYSQDFLGKMRLAEQGDAEAQLYLGECYEYGSGIVKDKSEAVRWYRKAAEQGNASAQINLGKCYEYGSGIAEDKAEAVRWYRKAAEQGDANAQIKLGECYQSGLGIERDRIEAEKLYRKAADQGSSVAQYNLGLYLYLFRDSGKDEAVKWFRKAAEQGNVEGQIWLGRCYEWSKGVEKDYAEAIKWYRKAIELGNAEACEDLGRCYEYGKGVEKSYADAAKWYRIANKRGYNSSEAEQYILFKLIKKYLFFDTETTGVPQNSNAPASDTENWPRLVQLGWILTDEYGNTIKKGNEIVKPDGFVIPTDAAMVHGITTEKAMQEGKPLRDVIENFLEILKHSNCLVGHNISFDQRVVGAELCRLGMRDIVSKKQSICTMQSSVDYCKIPGHKGYKYPKLQELYNKLFGCNFDDAHNAMADITATRKCFFRLKRLGVISEGFDNSKDFDFENAEIVCCVKLKEFDKSNFECELSTNGQYYLLCKPSFTGMEEPLIAYASDGSGRLPDFSYDSLFIYQNGNDFFAEFGEGNYDNFND